MLLKFKIKLNVYSRTVLIVSGFQVLYFYRVVQILLLVKRILDYCTVVCVSDSTVDSHNLKRVPHKFKSFISYISEFQ